MRKALAGVGLLLSLAQFPCPANTNFYLVSGAVLSNAAVLQIDRSGWVYVKHEGGIGWYNALELSSQTRQLLLPNIVNLQERHEARQQAHAKAMEARRWFGLRLNFLGALGSRPGAYVLAAIVILFFAGMILWILDNIFTERRLRKILFPSRGLRRAAASGGTKSRAE